MLECSEIFRDDRKAAYLNLEGADRPLRSPLPHATLAAATGLSARADRTQLDAHDVAGILLFDPVNIRYALDSSNMQIWTMHNAALRAGAEWRAGDAVRLWELRASRRRARRCRRGAARDLVPLSRRRGGRARRRHAGSPRRSPSWCTGSAAATAGWRSTRSSRSASIPCGPRGSKTSKEQELTERARALKSPDEIALMRWTIRVAEAAMARMYEASEPGITERELWAILHHENARSGGDWLETKLVTAGPRTNPWFQECSDRQIRAGEMIAFDTDMVGPHGYCADVSRSWICGHRRMNEVQRGLYRTARDQIEHNLALIRPGLSFAEFNERSWRIPERHRPFRYSVAAHGVGMVDEWPFVLLHPDFDPAYVGRFETGQVICVEPDRGGRDRERQARDPGPGDCDRHRATGQLPWEDE